MTPSEPWRILGAATFLTLALAGAVLREGQARADGREVGLPVREIDAGALLAGDPVALELGGYLPEGSSCPPGTEGDGPGSPFEASRGGWVALASLDREWRVAGAAAGRDEASRLGPLVVRGRAWCRGGVRPLLGLDVGVSQFHPDRQEAEAVDRLLRNSRADRGAVLALVSVGKDGRARLKGLAIGARRVELDWF